MASGCRVFDGGEVEEEVEMEHLRPASDSRGGAALLEVQGLSWYLTLTMTSSGLHLV